MDRKGSVLVFLGCSCISTFILCFFSKSRIQDPNFRNMSLGSHFSRGVSCFKGQIVYFFLKKKGKQRDF